MPERSLRTLLETLSVERLDGTWSFRTGPDRPITEDAAMIFREQEGWTSIEPARLTDGGDNRWVWLELRVYSDLNAVGFLAAVAAALTDAEIPCNAVAAFHHDHIFVPEHMTGAAITAIESLKQAR